MERFMDLLQKCSLLQTLSARTIREELLPRAVLRKIPKGNYLIAPQERLDYFGIIVQGRVYTMHLFPDGSDSIIDVLEQAEVFGGDLMGTRSRISPYHAMAAEETELLYFPVRLIQDHSPLSEETRRAVRDQLLTLMAQENMRKEYRLAILSRKGMRDRIMTYLTMQAGKRHTKTFEIPFSRDAMAAFLCVNRSALSHELSLMQQEGIIRFRKNRFTICEGE